MQKQKIILFIISSYNLYIFNNKKKIFDHQSLDKKKYSLHPFLKLFFFY